MAKRSVQFYFDDDDEQDRKRFYWLDAAGHRKTKLLRALIDFLQSLFPDSTGDDVDHIIYNLQHGIGLNGGRSTPAPVMAAPVTKERKPRKPREKTQRKDPLQQPAQTSTWVRTPPVENAPAPVETTSVENAPPVVAAPQEKAAPTSTSSNRELTDAEGIQKLMDALGVM